MTWIRAHRDDLRGSIVVAVIWAALLADWFYEPASTYLIGAGVGWVTAEMTRRRSGP